MAEQMILLSAVLALLDAKIAYYQLQVDASENSFGRAGWAVRLEALSELRAEIVGDSVPSQPLTKRTGKLLDTDLKHRIYAKFVENHGLKTEERMLAAVWWVDEITDLVIEAVRAALEKNMPCDSSFKFIGTCVKRMPKYDNLWCPNCRARKAILDKMTVIIPRNSFQTKKVKT